MKRQRPLNHRERTALIARQFPPVRVLSSSYPWGGTFVNDYFGERLDVRAKDAQTKYEGVFAQELRALVEAEGNEFITNLTDLDDSVEVREFIESQTRGRRRGMERW